MESAASHFSWRWRLRKAVAEGFCQRIPALTAMGYRAWVWLWGVEGLLIMASLRLRVGTSASSACHRSARV